MRIQEDCRAIIRLPLKANPDLWYQHLSQLQVTSCPALFCLLGDSWSHQSVLKTCTLPWLLVGTPISGFSPVRKFVFLPFNKHFWELLPTLNFIFCVEWWKFDVHLYAWFSNVGSCEVQLWTRAAVAFFFLQMVSIEGHYCSRCRTSSAVKSLAHF